MNYLNKDITNVEGPCTIIHGVNCQGVMGSGVAKALYTKWPGVKTKYHQFCKHTPTHLRLGKAMGVDVGGGIRVVNAFTQFSYGRDKNKKYASVDSIKNSVGTFIKLLKSREDLGAPIYIPKIGCGLGGLDWETEVEPILLAIEKEFGIEFNVCEI